MPLSPKLQDSAKVKNFKMQSELCRLEQQFTLHSVRSEFLVNDTLSNTSFSTTLFLLTVLSLNSLENSYCTKGVGKTPPGVLLGDVHTTQKLSVPLP